MSNLKNRRNFVALGLVAMGASVYAGNGPLVPTIQFNEHEDDPCEPICYPQKGRTMNMEDIRGISKAGALLMGIKVYQAHNDVAAKQIFNDLKRLQFEVVEGVNLYEHAIRSASLAAKEMRRDDLEREYVVASLCLNLGKAYKVAYPYEMSAAVLRPYIDERIYLAMKNFGQYEIDHSIANNTIWKEVAENLHTWYSRAFVEEIKLKKETWLLRRLRKLLWSHAIFKKVPHEKVIPN